MKLCIDCAHCVQSVTYYPSHLGIHKSVHWGQETCRLTDVIYGNGYAGSLCVIERDTGECGSGAINFEPKPLPAPEPEKPKGWFRRLFA